MRPGRFLSSYLLLFIAFFKTTYKKPKVVPAKKTN